MEFNKLIPELSVSDFDRSIRFYVDVIGFRIEYQRKDPNFALLSLQGSQIMIQEMGKKWLTGELEYPFGRGVNFQIEVDDIDPVLESLKKHDYPIMAEPQENWYRKGNMLLGNMEFLVKDPNGYLLRFARFMGEKPVPD